MTATTTATSALKALFRFPCRGTDWQGRFLVGAGLALLSMFIPLVPALPLLGYLLLVMRKTATGEEPELLPWADWGRLFADGLRAFLVTVVFLLPGLAVFCLGYAVYVVSIVQVSQGDGGQSALALALFGGMGVMFACIALGVLLQIAGALLLPPALAHVAVQGHVGAAFRPREWWPLLRVNKLGYVIGCVLVGGLLAALQVGSVIIIYSLVCCCLWPLAAAPALFYLGLVGSAFFGQIYRDSQELLQQRPAPVQTA